ncbi:hypothetical protein B0H67DRAFT_646966 [Lasiosphaeris hirsuta]|uniref:Uncharacterized protein n=1 Tax=Lasiosphaeris hirsuta TaxID=260670 RepID=A0AA40A9A2_9PEZI|nr:hypothetical protein B0H67DRAFT_646966 [Lasiosphaeris hirsuta]
MPPGYGAPPLGLAQEDIKKSPISKQITFIQVDGRGHLESTTEVFHYIIIAHTVWYFSDLTVLPNILAAAIGNVNVSGACSWRRRAGEEDRSLMYWTELVEIPAKEDNRDPAEIPDARITTQAAPDSLRSPDQTLKPKLQQLLVKKTPRNKCYEPDETNIIVSVTDRSQRDLTKRFDELDIDWEVVEDDRKHYKLDTSVLTKLVDYAEEGNMLRTHGDVPPWIRELIYAKE